MERKLKTAVTLLILIGLLLWGIAKGKDFLIQHTTDKLMDAIGAKLNQDKEVLVEARRLAENLQQAQTLNTRDRKKLREMVEMLEGTNNALKLELAALQEAGSVTSVATTTGQIKITGADSTEIPQTDDFVRQFTDPWIQATVERRGQKLFHEYATTFTLTEFDIEVTLDNGVKTHLFNTALVSDSTGDTLHIPTERHIIEQAPGAAGFHFLPRLHLRGAGGLGNVWIGAGVSAFSWGRGKYTEGTSFYLLEGTVLARSDGVLIAVTPISWNAGTKIPLLTNFNIGIAYGWGEQQSGVLLVIGATL